MTSRNQIGQDTFDQRDLVRLRQAMVAVLDKGDLRVVTKRRDQFHRVFPGNIRIGHALHDAHRTAHVNRTA